MGYSYKEASKLTPGRILAITLGAIGLIVMLMFGSSTFETVDQYENLVVQDAVDGELHWYTSAGIKPQWFGKTTAFTKNVTVKFEAPIRFNDNGHGKLIGSVLFKLPTSDTNLTQIYTTFQNTDGLIENLLQKVIDKSVLSTGALLSSTESSAEKRSDLLQWVEDQIQNGVYKTTRRDVRTKDPITGEDKTVTVAEILMVNGQPARQEISQLAVFGVTSSNFTLKDVSYEQDVEHQIAAQRANIMKVQTAISESKAAEQQALTAEQQGKANAAKAKWDKEAEKAAAVTVAQQEYEVAALDARTAAQEKQAVILRGEGAASARRLAMQADNALEVKGKLWLEAQKAWAEALGGNANLVPSVMFGGGNGTNAGSSASAIMDLIGAKMAKDLSFDPGIKRAQPDKQ